jgi:hypothetical protein
MWKQLLFLGVFALVLVSAATASHVKDHVDEEVPTKTYNSTSRTVTIKYANNTNAIVAKLNTPQFHYVPTGNNILFAEIRLQDLSFRDRDFLDAMSFEDLKRSKLTTIPFQTKWANASSRLVCRDDRDIRSCVSESTIEWIPFTKLNEIPSKTAKIGFFANFTKASERIEWVPTFFGVSVPEWATFETQDGVTQFTTSANVTLSTTIDPDHSFVLITYFLGGAVDTSPLVEILNSTTIRFTNDGGGTADVGWDVVENSDVYVQRGTETFGSGATILVNLTTPIQINRTFVTTSSESGGLTGSQFGRVVTRATIINTTQIMLERGASGVSGPEVHYQVIEWNGSTVQAGELTSVGLADTVNITAVQLNQSFIYSETTSTTAFPHVTALGAKAAFVNTTQIRVGVGATSASVADMSYYVVSHPDFFTQTGETNHSAATAITHLSTTVNNTNSFISNSHSINDSSVGTNRFFTRANLQNDTSIDFEKVNTFSPPPVSHQWFVIEMSADAADTTPPVISAVANVSITNQSATITWTTDEASNSTVNYGTTTAVGTFAGSDTDVTSHSVGLSGLTNNTLYYYNVTSCDAADNCNTSIQYNFTTLANAADTCTYTGPGDWVIDMTDNCVITTNYNVTGRINFTGATGTSTFNASSINATGLDNPPTNTIMYVGSNLLMRIGT